MDPVRGTITDGIHTYRYTFSGDASSYEIRITYPNGAVYYWSHSGHTGHGGWSDDYDEHAYADGNILCDVIAAGAPMPVHTGKILAAILLLIIGAINAAFPRTAWTLQYGWRYKNAEPSGFAIGWNRVIGFLAVLISVFLFFS